MTVELMKIMKDAEKKRHENHVNAGKQNWQNIISETKQSILKAFLKANQKEIDTKEKEYRDIDDKQNEYFYMLGIRKAEENLKNILGVKQ